MMVEVSIFGSVVIARSVMTTLPTPQPTMKPPCQPGTYPVAIVLVSVKEVGYGNGILARKRKWVNNTPSDPNQYSMTLAQENYRFGAKTVALPSPLRILFVCPCPGESDVASMIKVTRSSGPFSPVRWAIFPIRPRPFLVL
jgi:hypothetical protein